MLGQLAGTVAPLVRLPLTLAHGVEPLISTVESELLPALASLEGLVPVVAQLGVQVDNLDSAVADVGSLLGGIP